LQINEILGLISGLIIIPVYVSYFLQTKNGHSIPNPATWSIWLAVMLLNSATYSRMVGNFFESFLAIIVPVLLAIMLVYFVTLKKFAPLGKTEKVVLVLTFSIGILWKLTDATVSNLCLQVILLISFYPTVRGLVQNGLKEKPLPWLLGVTAYLFLIAANLMDFHGDYAKLVFPIVNGVVGNGTVAVIAIMKKGS